MTTARRPRRAALALAAAAVLVLTGCSAGPEAEPSATPTEDEDGGGASDGPTRTGQGGDGGGGVSGLIAAVSGSLMQVQEADSQTAVTWTDDTVFTRNVTVGLDAITVGSCVVAVAPATTDDPADDAADDPADDAAATSVTVSEPVDGECAAGFGGFGGAGGPMGELPDGAEPPEGFARPEGGELPEGMSPPEGGELPEGMVGGGAFGRLVSGRVTAVAGSTVTVEVTDPDGATTTETIGTSAGTVVTTTVTADATAVEVGLCASVRGETDTRGGMAAVTVTLSEAGENGCVVRMAAPRASADGDR